MTTSDCTMQHETAVIDREMQEISRSGVALITGAADGIGWATARRLAREFAHIVLMDVRAEPVMEKARELGESHMGLHADVTSEQDVARAARMVMARFGRVDAIVNNAGIGEQARPTLDQDLDYFDKVLSVHIRGAYLMSREFARVMLPRKRGSIVNIGSIVGVRGVPWRNAYGAAKAGVLAMTRATACEWGREGIRVNAVIPGYVRTQIVAELEARGALDRVSMEARTPLGRLAEPGEISEAIAFLSSPRASFITGTSLAVDGGWIAMGAN